MSEREEEDFGHEESALSGKEAVIIENETRCYLPKEEVRKQWWFTLKF